MPTTEELKKLYKKALYMDYARNGYSPPNDTVFEYRYKTYMDGLNPEDQIMEIYSLMFPDGYIPFSNVDVEKDLLPCIMSGKPMEEPDDIPEGAII